MKNVKVSMGAFMKKGGSSKKFPDLNKDGKITKADILVGKGVIPKKSKGGATGAGKTTTGVVSNYKGYTGPKNKKPVAKVKKSGKL